MRDVLRRLYTTNVVTTAFSVWLSQQIFRQHFSGKPGNCQNKPDTRCTERYLDSSLLPTLTDLYFVWSPWGPLKFGKLALIRLIWERKPWEEKSNIVGRQDVCSIKQLKNTIKAANITGFILGNKHREFSHGQWEQISWNKWVIIHKN